MISIKKTPALIFLAFSVQVQAADNYREVCSRVKLTTETIMILRQANFDMLAVMNSMYVETGGDAYSAVIVDAYANYPAHLTSRDAAKAVNSFSGKYARACIEEMR